MKAPISCFGSILMQAAPTPGKHRLPEALQRNIWKPGQSGNPRGRPAQARSRWSEAFFQDIADDWQRGGAEAIERVRNDDPSTYLRVCAALMPREVSIATTRELSEGELESQLSAALALLGGVTIEGVALPAGEPAPVPEDGENG